ncbi:MAG: nitroreductase family deazaflavin-dependent oxidoreductase [Actinomycetota bacterium]
MKPARKDAVVRAAAAVHRWVYRRTGGRVGGRLARSPVLLLTTTGRRTGKARTTPLLYLADGDRLVIVASYGGDDRAPAWYRNLEANREVAVEVGRSRRFMQAEDAAGDERERLWERLTRMYPPYHDYQARTSRRIPVVVLTPR